MKSLDLTNNETIIFMLGGLVGTAFGVALHVLIQAMS